MTSTDLNRRRKRRIPIGDQNKQTAAHLHINHTSYPCSIVNMSSGGLCLKLKDTFDPGPDPDGYLSLDKAGAVPGDEHAIRLRWIERGQGWVVAGVEFSGSEAATAESILSWLGHPKTEHDQLTGVEWL